MSEMSTRRCRVSEGLRGPANGVESLSDSLTGSPTVYTYGTRTVRRAAWSRSRLYRYRGTRSSVARGEGLGWVPDGTALTQPPTVHVPYSTPSGGEQVSHWKSPAIRRRVVDMMSVPAFRAASSAASRA